MILADATLDTYKVSFEMMRHYSNLRFTMLTVFVGISTALFALAIKSVVTGSPPRISPQADLFPFKASMFAGIGIAIVFSFAEYRIGSLFDFFWERTTSLGKELGMKEEAYSRAPDAFLWRHVILFLFLAVYVGLGALWVIAWRHVQNHVQNVVPLAQGTAQPTGAAQPVPPPDNPPGKGPCG
jgi:hypothetical protein